MVNIQYCSYWTSFSRQLCPNRFTGCVASSSLCAWRTNAHGRTFPQALPHSALGKTHRCGLVKWFHLHLVLVLFFWPDIHVPGPASPLWWFMNGNHFSPSAAFLCGSGDGARSRPPFWGPTPPRSMQQFSISFPFAANFRFTLGWLF